MLQEIQARLTDFRKSEQKVGRLVLAQPRLITSLALADVAQRAGVSEPTVLRFCRGVGCTGFQDLKMRLVAELARLVPYVPHGIEWDDKVSSFALKVCDRTVATLQSVRSMLDFDKLEHAIEWLVKAERIEFFGFGASGIVAADAQNKFFRFGVPTNACCDPHVQVMSAAVLMPGSVLVAISHKGRNADLLQSVEIALAREIPVIAITGKDSPLALKASIALEVEVPEDTTVQTPMTSRIAHLLVLDILQVGVALKRGPGSIRQLEQAKSNLNRKHVQSEIDIRT